MIAFTVRTPSDSRLGDLLRRYRRAAGLSQAALASRAGLSTDAVAALERGRRTTPRADTLALSRYIGDRAAQAAVLL
ncbi:MAG TPA: helix-turn-helix transcriptional regulator [Chloroflexota bacterium]|nr:helix-turn-helix transcriptional regulator [Chloroflexota bacterium]